MKGARKKCAMADIFIMFKFFPFGIHIEMTENPYFFTDYLCCVSHSKVQAILNIRLLKEHSKKDATDNHVLPQP